MNSYIEVLDTKWHTHSRQSYRGYGVHLHSALPNSTLDFLKMFVVDTLCNNISRVYFDVLKKLNTN